MIYHKTEYRERRDHFAYFACSEPLAGFDTQREAFLGAYRGWDKPAAVERGRVVRTRSRTAGRRSARTTSSSRSSPARRRQIIFLLGYHENPATRNSIRPARRRSTSRRSSRSSRSTWTRPTSDAAFDGLRAYWDGLLGIYQVETPDVHTDRMVNIWNAYQCMVTFNMSRSASFFESGIGRGLGFRDSNQDLLGFVHMVPDARPRAHPGPGRHAAAHGGAYHQYQPLTKRGNNDVGGNFNDDPLWLILGVAAYLKETGDWSILDEPVPYDNQPGTETAALRAPAAQLPLHAGAARAARPAADRPRRLERLPEPELLLRHAGPIVPDHDQQGRQGGRVGLHRRAVRAGGARRWRRSPRRSRPGRTRPSAICDEAAKMDATVHEHGWDGEWFLRAYDDFGHKVGSQECEEGQDLHRAAGHVRHGRHRPGGRPGRAGAGIGATSIWPRRTASCCSSRPTRSTTCTWARSRPTRRATRRTPASSATTTPGS